MTDLEFAKKNLEIIKNLVELEDYETAFQRLSFLANNEKAIFLDGSLSEIFICFENKNYIEALKKISKVLSILNHALLSNNYEYMALLQKKKELDAKKEEISKLKFNLQKKINEFHRRYHFEIGELLEEIYIKKIALIEKAAELNPALNVELAKIKQEYESFRNETNSDYNISKIELDYEDAILLKKLFRKACKLCHPDFFEGDQKKEAETLFIELKLAYDKNDLLAVSNILEYLEENFSTKSKKLSAPHFENNPIETLIKEIKRLKIQIEKDQKEIEELKNSAAYKIIVSYPDLDDYFVPKRKKLEEELRELSR